MTDNMREYSHYAVGVPGAPYPMSDRKLITDAAHDTQVPPVNVSALQPIERSVVQMMDKEHPLIISTRRHYDEALGIMYREAPLPSMLPIYRDAWHAREPDSGTRIQAILGDTGVGKSFMVESIALARDPRGAIIVDCYDRMDLGELLWETVLDTNGHQKEVFEQINDKLKAGKLHPGHKAILESQMKDVFVNGELRWDLLGYNGGTKTPEQLIADTNALERVAKLEHMSNGHDKIFTLKKTEGKLIQAAKEGREVLINEYDKTDAKSAVGLYGLLHVLRGSHNNEWTTSGGPGQSFTFKRDALPKGFFVSLTGNLTHDGRAGRLMADSEAARIQPVIIPKMTSEDMQHRICQEIAGVPISTYYYMRPNQWDKNPTEFTQFLKAIRMAGKPGHIPTDQLSYIENWQDTLKASALLTQYHMGVKQILDPKWLNGQPSLDGIAQEVTAELKKNLGAGDLNYILNDIRNGRRFKPKCYPPNQGQDIIVDSFFSSPVAPPEKTEAVEEHYGDRLVARTLERIERTIDANHRPLLAAYLDKMARVTGLKPLNDAEATTHPDHVLVCDLLNQHPYKDITPSGQAKLVQKLVADLLRKKHAGLSDIDEDIVPLAIIIQELEQLKSNQLAPGTATIVVPNVIDDVRTVHGKPLTEVIVQDAIQVGEHPVKIKTENLLDIDTFLQALAMPNERETILKGLWTSAMKHSGIVENPAVEIAEGTHDSGLAITTVALRSERGGIRQAIPVHIFMNKNTGKILIIGEGEANENLFKQKDIIYVNRNHSDALTHVETAMRDMCQANANDVIIALKQAFTLRNQVDPKVLDGALNVVDLAKILTDPALSELNLPVQITKITRSHMETDDKYAGYRQVIEKNRKLTEASTKVAR